VGGTGGDRGRGRAGRRCGSGARGGWVEAGAGVEVTAAGVGEVDVAAAAAMVPLRSHDFGGEVIDKIGGLRVHRNT
jgi:hypothetical protein